MSLFGLTPKSNTYGVCENGLSPNGTCNPSFDSEMQTSIPKNSEMPASMPGMMPKNSEMPASMPRMMPKNEISAITQSVVVKQPMCSGGKIQLPHINRKNAVTYSTILHEDHGTSFAKISSIDDISINNKTTDNDLCYNRCPNGEAPVPDFISGQYMCLVPATITYTAISGTIGETPTDDSIDYEKGYTVSCQSTDLMNQSGSLQNHTNNIMFGTPVLLKSGFYEDPSPPGTIRSNDFIPAGNSKWFCKRPVFGSPTINQVQSPYEYISNKAMNNVEETISIPAANEVMTEYCTIPDGGWSNEGNPPMPDGCKVINQQLEDGTVKMLGDVESKFKVMAKILNTEQAVMTTANQTDQPNVEIRMKIKDTQVVTQLPIQDSNQLEIPKKKIDSAISNLYGNIPIKAVVTPIGGESNSLTVVSNDTSIDIPNTISIPTVINGVTTSYQPEEQTVKNEVFKPCDPINIPKFNCSNDISYYDEQTVPDVLAIKDTNDLYCKISICYRGSENNISNDVGIMSEDSFQEYIKDIKNKQDNALGWIPRGPRGMLGGIAQTSQEQKTSMPYASPVIGPFGFGGAGGATK